MAGYTETQRQALKDAIASGELTVEYDGKRVTYRSIPELERALARVEAELDGDQGTPLRRLRLFTRKGW